MLFDPLRHQPLSATAWDEARARDALQEIVSDALGAMQPGVSWPMHPRDDDGDLPSGGFKGTYLGSAGVLWALWFLQQQGAIDTALDFPEAMARVSAAYVADPDSGERVPSYFLGEAGILLAQWRMSPSDDIAARLHEVVEANLRNPTLEALWGAPGTMLAAWHMWQQTKDMRWAELFRRNADELIAACGWDEQRKLRVWTQDLYGKKVRYLGAGHGFVGNVFPLLLGGGLLGDAQRETVTSWCERLLQETALEEDGAANWLPGLWQGAQSKVLMQWCHGAPGIVTSLAPLRVGTSPVLDALLLEAGEAVWRAGPLSKGASLCHGTAGNGQALLALFQRTGDVMWLSRARLFAMHAVAQSAEDRRAVGRGRYTLWTGDVGVALFLWDCLQGRYRGMPLLDFA
jgi:hypothetical protein